MAPNEPILVFYDGWCSICIRSAERFRKYDDNRGIVRCIDFRSDPEATTLAGTDTDTLSASLHAKFPNGDLLNGPEAIRRTLHALGRGSLASWTRWPLIRPVVDLLYRIFAKNRMRFFSTHTCENGACSVPHREPPQD